MMETRATLEQDGLDSDSAFAKQGTFWREVHQSFGAENTTNANHIEIKAWAVLFCCSIEEWGI